MVRKAIQPKPRAKLFAIPPEPTATKSSEFLKPTDSRLITQHPDETPQGEINYFGLARVISMDTK